MQVLMVLVLAGLAAAGRLENAYLPPANADQAGGYNLPLPALQQNVATHTEAVIAPSNTYLPPTNNNIIIEAKLQQPPKPLGGSGILKQEGLQSTLGFGAPAPLQPTQAPSLPQVSSYTSSSQASASLPQASGFPVGSQQASFSAPSFGSQQTSSLSKTSSFSFGSQQASAAPQASPFGSSFGSQQSAFSQQISAAPKASPFGSQQSAFSSFNGQQASSSFAAKTNTAFGSQQASAGLGLRQGGFFAQSQRQTPSIAIVRSSNVNNGDGSYTYSYETENGIQAQEQGEFRQGGAEGATVAQGAFAFTAPDTNERFTVTYTADENGFHAYGDHLPTPPPIPEAILQSIELNAREEAATRQQGYQQDYQQGYQQNNQQGYQLPTPQRQASYQQPAPQRQSYQVPVVSQRQSYQQQSQQQGYQPSNQQQQGFQQQQQQGYQQRQGAQSDAGYRY